mgnify:CR=1 FL=1
MMRKFMDENFLLSTPTAEKLYHNIAEKLPIIDYHCHINPRDIAEEYIPLRFRCSDRKYHLHAPASGAL